MIVVFGMFTGKHFGCTEFVNPKEHDKPIQEVLKNMTGHGCDFTFECIGNVEVMGAALEATSPGWGKFIPVGIAPEGHKISVTPFVLLMGVSVQGCLFGGKFK